MNKLWRNIWYNISIWLYLAGVAVYSIFNNKVRKMWKGERQAFQVLQDEVDPSAQYVWFHAASLGEFEQGRPLIELFRKECPQYKILLTFFSPSGYEVRKNYEGADIVCYLPLDTIANARRFLRLIRPVAAFFIKYEFWYNYLHILKHRNVPVYSVSSIFRPGQVFFKWYGRSYAAVLECFTHFFVQNDESRRLLAGLGLHNVSIVGDTRFDRVLQIKEAAKQLPLVEAFCRGGQTGERHSQVFVAGSSWQPDEDIFTAFFNRHPEWKIIIAPHVIDEDHLQRIESSLKGRSLRYTRTTEAEATQAQCLIIDCFGLLSSIYRYADVCYVGGGFGAGIHNVVEAAVWQKPVIFGPNNARFQEAQGLKAVGGGLEIESTDDFDSIMNRFIGKPETRRQAGDNAGKYVSDRAGATQTIFHHVCNGNSLITGHNT